VSRRHVSIHLTSYAPDVERVAMHDPARWISHWSKSPAWVMQNLCERLQVAADAVSVRPGPDGTDDIEILGPSAAAPGAPVCLALVNYGLEVAEIAGALAGLAQGRRAAA
jgi:hypothetical protein